MLQKDRALERSRFGFVFHDLLAVQPVLSMPPTHNEDAIVELTDRMRGGLGRRDLIVKSAGSFLRVLDGAGIAAIIRYLILVSRGVPQDQIEQPILHPGIPFRRQAPREPQFERAKCVSGAQSVVVAGFDHGFQRTILYHPGIGEPGRRRRPSEKRLSTSRRTG